MTPEWLTSEVDKLESTMRCRHVEPMELPLRPMYLCILENALKRGYSLIEFHAVMAAFHQRQLQRLEEAKTR